mmetsp:Transcript_28829/g.92991  ORF Transcript_28829/g.92991 Transcript_28829/m.92991 type:complete len:242 (-) Transcript_28829:811-1536(-)
MRNHQRAEGKGTRMTSMVTRRETLLRTSRSLLPGRTGMHILTDRAHLPSHLIVVTAQRNLLAQSKCALKNLKPPAKEAWLPRRLPFARQKRTMPAHHCLHALLQLGVMLLRANLCLHQSRFLQHQRVKRAKTARTMQMVLQMRHPWILWTRQAPTQINELLNLNSRRNHRRTPKARICLKSKSTAKKRTKMPTFCLTRLRVLRRNTLLARTIQILHRSILRIKTSIRILRTTSFKRCIPWE